MNWGLDGCAHWRKVTITVAIKLSWNDFYQDKGIKWELIISETSETIKTYSFRFSQKYRGIAYRDGDYLVLLDLYVNHNGAYK